MRVTRCALRGVRRAQSVVGRSTGQCAVGMRRMESRARVVGELVGVIVREKAVLDANHRLRSRQQINQVEYDSGDEPFAFPVHFIRETACEDNIVAVKINGTATKMLVDSGAQFTVLGEREFHSLVRSGLKAKLQQEERNLRGYGNGCYRLLAKLRLLLNVMGRR